MAYFNAKRRKQKPHLASFGSFFYPLDGVGQWNRLYGPAGLYQHQSVIPSMRRGTLFPPCWRQAARLDRLRFSPS